MRAISSLLSGIVSSTALTSTVLASSLLTTAVLAAPPATADSADAGTRTGRVGDSGKGDARMRGSDRDGSDTRHAAMRGDKGKSAPPSAPAAAPSKPAQSAQPSQPSRPSVAPPPQSAPSRPTAPSTPSAAPQRPSGTTTPPAAPPSRPAARPSEPAAPRKPIDATPAPSRPSRDATPTTKPPVRPANESAPRRPTGSTIDRPMNPPMVSPSEPRKPAPAKPRDDAKPREDAKPRDNARPESGDGSRPSVRPDRDDKPVTRTPTPTKSPDARAPRERDRDGRGDSAIDNGADGHGGIDTRRPNEATKPVRGNDAATDLGGERGRGGEKGRGGEGGGRGNGSSNGTGNANGTVVGDTVFGVPVARGRDLSGERGGDGGARENKGGGGGGGSHDRHDGRGRGRDGGDDGFTIYNDNRTYTQYVTNISHCNGWSHGSRWADCGPCHTWDRYDCHDGVSLSIGFGSGFSFGFFYGSSCAPLCSSWCNPWWEGYACSWSVSAYSGAWRPWYRPGCGWVNPCRPWWHTWYACGPCPVPAWTPCYSYYPYGATYVYAPVVYAPPVVVPTLPNPDALWTYLAEGYDRDAEDGFILLESSAPNDARWVAGQAIARAFRSDTVRAAMLLREAFALDAAVMTRLSQDPKFLARLDALERAVEPAAIAPQPSIDALLVMASVQAARGDVQAAYLNATTAESEGDRSAGTASFIAWLRAELRRRP